MGSEFMKKIGTSIAYLLALSTEIIVYMIAAVYFGGLLNESYNMSFDWIMITVPFSLLLSGFSSYRFFVNIIKTNNKKE